MSRCGAAPGFSLLELLVALCLLGTCLLAIAALESTVIRRNAAAFRAHVALSAADETIERMGDNAAAAIGGRYADAAGSGAPDCTSLPCTPEQRAVWDLAAVRAAIAPDTSRAATGFGGLSGSTLAVRCASVPCGTGAAWLVSVSWNEPGETVASLAAVNLVHVP